LAAEIGGPETLEAPACWPGRRCPSRRRLKLPPSRGRC